MLDTPTDRVHALRAGVGTYFRPAQLNDLGISYDQLRRLEVAGAVERVARGLYRFADDEPTEHETIAAVCARVPQAIVCLLTALVLREIGTALPHQVWIAIPHKARLPRLPHLPVRVVRFSGAAQRYGVEAVEFAGVPARITSPARTIVDCFRYERLVGRDTAIEALEDALRYRRVTSDALRRTLEELPSKRLKAALEVLG